MVRVRVDEQTWQGFRHEIGPNTVAERLGELVVRDLAERRGDGCTLGSSISASSERPSNKRGC